MSELCKTQSAPQPDSQDECLSYYQPVRWVLIEGKPFSALDDLPHVVVKSYHGNTLKSGYGAVTRFLRLRKNRSRVLSLGVFAIEFRRWKTSPELDAPTTRLEYRLSELITGLDWLCGDRPHVDPGGWATGWLEYDRKQKAQLQEGRVRRYGTGVCI